MVCKYDDESDNQRKNFTKRIKVFLWIMAPNDQCDAEANNHELGQQALSFWEGEKRARNCVPSEIYKTNALSCCFEVECVGLTIDTFVA